MSKFSLFTVFCGSLYFYSKYFIYEKCIKSENNAQTSFSSFPLLSANAYVNAKFAMGTWRSDFLQKKSDKC